MLIMYPIYPSALSIEKFFIKRASQNSAITEYEILKKIVYALFPFFIFGFIYIIGEQTMRLKNPLSFVIIAHHMVWYM
jgi:hypothetical protein